MKIVLIIDDVLVVLLIALIGIGFHQSDPSLISRMPYTFLPFAIAWIFFAWILQLYEPGIASAWAQIWRIPLASALAAPFGAIFRSMLISTPLIPTFVVVMAAVLAIGLLISRSFFILVFGKRWSTQDNG